MQVLVIFTIEPCSGKTMSRPACELYRTYEQAMRNVLRREYEAGIATWVKRYNIPFTRLPDISPVDELF